MSEILFLRYSQCDREECFAPYILEDSSALFVAEEGVRSTLLGQKKGSRIGRRLESMWSACGEQRRGTESSGEHVWGTGEQWRAVACSGKHPESSREHAESMWIALESIGDHVESYMESYGE